MVHVSSVNVQFLRDKGFILFEWLSLVVGCDACRREGRAAGRVWEVEALQGPIEEPARLPKKALIVASSSFTNQVSCS
jgi:hypothetical protein